MIYVRSEGSELRNGINFYPWSDRKNSIGFILRWNSFAVWFRYSPRSKKCFFTTSRLT